MVSVSISWGTAQSLLLFFGPLLLPRVLGFYRRLRSPSSASGVQIQSCPPSVLRAISLLVGVSLVYLVKSHPYFAPENLFTATSSRLQAPTDVLFSRVAKTLRSNDNGTLIATDQALRGKFVNMESRLLYAQFGPEVIAGCTFCTSDDPNWYLYYALPTLFVPHLLNLVLVGAATSGLWTGHKGGAEWRVTATVAAALLAATDIYMVCTYEHTANKRSPRLVDVDWFYWNMRELRLRGLASLNVILSCLMWLSSTNRMFTRPPSTAERLERISRALAVTKSRVNAAGIVKNAAVRDDALRGRIQGYWTHEVALMSDVMEDREVIEGVNDALENRINIEGIIRDAESYAGNVLQPLGE